MQIEPNQKVGYCSKSMVVVVCPQCHQKRWANIMSVKAHEHQARTTCCGVVVDYRGVEQEVKERLPVRGTAQRRYYKRLETKPESKVVIRPRR